MPWPSPARRDRLRSWEATAAALTGPLYAVAGAEPVFQGGFGHSGSGADRTVSVAVRHVRPGADVEVDTSDEQPWPGGDDWRLTSDWLHRVTRPGEVSFPLTVTADRWEQQVPVDGVPVPFVFVGDRSAWAAASEVGGRSVSLSASGWPSEGLALRSVPPVEVSSEVPEV